MKQYVCYIVLLIGFAACKSNIDGKLTAAANEVNKSCPMMVDKETRLDNAMALPGKTFQYRYTLINYAKNQIDTSALKTSITPGMIEGLKTMPELKFYRDNKVTMEYSYKDKNGAYLMKIVLTGDQYAK